MKKRTEAQNKKLHLLLYKAGLADEKPELVSFYSNGRTSSSRELYFQEAEKLIKYLETITPNMMPTKTEQADKHRKRILSICYQLGWIENTEDPNEKKINLAVIDNFLKQRGYIKKPLNHFTLKELPKLVTQFRQILENSKKTAGSKAVKNLLSELNIPVQSSNRK